MAIDLAPLPPAAALRALRARGLRPVESWDWRDVAAKEHARAFTVARSLGFDILEDLHRSLVEAMASGETFESWRRRIVPILIEKGWWGKRELADPLTGEVRAVQLGSPRRLRIIYDTNLRVSHARGLWERIERQAERRPWLRYRAVRDERTRRRHRHWHDTLLRWDDPWWDTHFPPNGWRCRCTVTQLSDRDLARKGLTPTDPAPSDPTPPQVWRNPRTGAVTQVPAGIDPGWAHHPGKAAAPLVDPARHDHPALGHAAARLAVRAPDLARMLAGEITQGTIPVGYVDAELAAVIGATARRVDLSAETAAKQARRHPELLVQEYQVLPEMLTGRGIVVRQDAVKLAFIEESGRWYKAVLKATRDGRALFLVSFQRLHGDARREIRRELRRSVLIRGDVGTVEG